MKNKKILSIIFNSIIALSSFYIIIERVFFSSSQDMLSWGGIRYLKAFTNQSGLLTGIASLIIVICNIRYLKNGKLNPIWVEDFHLATSVAEAITFITVATFLSPMYEDYFFLFKSDMFHFHFLNCVLAVVSYLFLNNDNIGKMKDKLIGSVNAILYSFLYMPMVLTNTWSDFYGFTFGGHYEFIPIVLLIMYSLSFGLSVLFNYIHNKNKVA